MVAKRAKSLPVWDGVIYHVIVSMSVFPNFSIMEPSKESISLNAAKTLGILFIILLFRNNNSNNVLFLYSRLFQNLKNEHQSEKQDLLYKLKECETKLARKEAELKKNEEERLSLEQGNFDLAFECDSLKKRISELESREINAAAGETVNAERDRTIKQDLHETKKLLR